MKQKVIVELDSNDYIELKRLDKPISPLVRELVHAYLHTADVSLQEESELLRKEQELTANISRLMSERAVVRNDLKQHELERKEREKKQADVLKEVNRMKGEYMKDLARQVALNG